MFVNERTLFHHLKQTGTFFTADCISSQTGGDGTIIKVHLLPQQATVVNRGQVSVMDLDELVQVLGFLHLVLKLESRAVQNLPRHKADEEPELVKLRVQ